MKTQNKINLSLVSRIVQALSLCEHKTSLANESGRTATNATPMNGERHANGTPLHATHGEPNGRRQTSDRTTKEERRGAIKRRRVGNKRHPMLHQVAHQPPSDVLRSDLPPYLRRTTTARGTTLAPERRGPNERGMGHKCRTWPKSPRSLCDQ